MCVLFKIHALVTEIKFEATNELIQNDYKRTVPWSFIYTVTVCVNGNNILK